MKEWKSMQTSLIQKSFNINKSKILIAPGKSMKTFCPRKKRFQLIYCSQDSIDSSIVPESWRQKRFRRSFKRKTFHLKSIMPHPDFENSFDDIGSNCWITTQQKQLFVSYFNGLLVTIDFFRMKSAIKTTTRSSDVCGETAIHVRCAVKKQLSIGKIPQNNIEAIAGVLYRLRMLRINFYDVCVYCALLFVHFSIVLNNPLAAINFMCVLYAVTSCTEAQ